VPERAQSTSYITKGAGTKPAFGKMRRKEFEKELAKLQVELTIACAL
jgi:hypothetical protein